MWEAFKKIYDTLKQDEHIRITGLDEIRHILKRPGIRKASGEI